MTSVWSISIRFPKPWQVGQAPRGLLKEKSCGWGSSYARPQPGQSKRSEKRSVGPPVSVHRGACRLPRGTRPPAPPTRREVAASSSFTRSTSTTHGSDSSRSLSASASTVTASPSCSSRRKPRFWRFSSRSRAASRRPPSGSRRARTIRRRGPRSRSAADSGVSRATSAPQAWQATRPARANRTRRWSCTSVAVATVERGLRDGRALADRDRGAHAVDRVQGRLLQPLQELPGERGQALDVAPLALGVERVEGQAALARSGDARHHHQALGRDGDVDALQVVDADAARDDRFSHGIGAPRQAALRRSRQSPIIPSGCGRTRTPALLLLEGRGDLLFFLRRGRRRRSSPRPGAPSGPPARRPPRSSC